MKFLHMALVPMCPEHFCFTHAELMGHGEACFQPYNVSRVFKIRLVVIVLTFTFTGSL